MPYFTKITKLLQGLGLVGSWHLRDTAELDRTQPTPTAFRSLGSNHHYPFCPILFLLLCSTTTTSTMGIPSRLDPYHPGVPSSPRRTNSPHKPRNKRNGFHASFLVVSCLLTLIMVATGWMACRNNATVRYYDGPEHDRPMEMEALKKKYHPPKQQPTLVVYAGPSNKEARKAALYRTNLDHFLKHGIDCAIQDTVVVVGHDYYEDYRDRIAALQQACSRYPRRGQIVLVPRRDVCYDMEAVRLVFYGGVPGIDARTYDYFVYANCGAAGPPPKDATQPWWTTRLTELLDDRCKMAGLTVHCERNLQSAHVMSMVYALDREGIDVIYQSGAVFDCLDDRQGPKKDSLKDVINNYERQMGRVLLANNYTLRPLLGAHPRQTVAPETLPNCFPCRDREALEEDGVSCADRAWTGDVWMESRLRQAFGGRLPSLDEVVFYKSSRVLPPAVAEQIRFTGNVTWTWK